MTDKLPENGKVEIRSVSTAVTSQELTNFETKTWLAGQTDGYQWLLAHTTEGVVWGRREGTAWHLSSGLIPSSPPLDTNALLELRLFDETSEVYLWRDGAHFCGRWIKDDVTVSDGTHEFYDEPQILWGTRVTALKNGFTLMQDGSEGLAHAIPCAAPTSLDEEIDLGPVRPAALLIRHYVVKDEDPQTNTGLARVVFSRLVNVSLDTQKILEVKNGTQA